VCFFCLVYFFVCLVVFFCLFVFFFLYFLFFNWTLLREWLSNEKKKFSPSGTHYCQWHSVEKQVQDVILSADTFRLCKLNIPLLKQPLYMCNRSHLHFYCLEISALTRKASLFNSLPKNPSNKYSI